eukprot:2179165-Pyramimonas_sp.AAC.1
MEVMKVLFISYVGILLMHEAQIDLDGLGLRLLSRPENAADDTVENSASQQQQIEVGGMALLAAPAPVPRHVDRRFGSDRASAARSTRSIQCLKRKLVEKDAECNDKKVALDTVAVMLPGASQLLGKECHQLGKMKKQNLTPDHFGLCVRALHLPLNRTPSLGVKSHRLLEVGCQVIQQRQMDGLVDTLRRCGAALRSPSARAEERLAHVTHCHMWDE